MGKRKWETIFGVGVAVAIVSLIVGLLVGTSSGTKTAAVAATPKPSSTPAASCWTVKLDPNQGNRVLSSGVTGTPDQVRTKLLNAAQHDPRVLQALYNVTSQGATKPVTDWHSLVTPDGKCYNQQGQALWNKTGVLYTTANATKATAPATGCNTYVTPGGNASCKMETITGNRAGTKFDFGNGKWVVVMYRCGNPVTPGKPPVQVPQTPTTTPPTHQPGPTPSCTQPPYAGTTGYKQVGPCQWTKDSSNVFECQQGTSGTQGCPPNQTKQSVQPNPCCNTGSTAGAPSSPPPPPQPGPTPTQGSAAPTPAPSPGYDSGSSSGSGTPGGTACDSSCTGGGATAGSGPTDTTNSGDNNGTDGSGTSTGSGDPGNPFS